MTDLLKVHNNMLKQAKVDNERKERIDAIVKYASTAEELLAEKYGEDYEQEDVSKLAEWMIENDLEALEWEEKVAEYDQLGRIMANSFVDEMKNKKDSK